MIIGREREITRGWDASRQSGGSFCMEWNRDGWKEEVKKINSQWSYIFYWFRSISTLASVCG